MSLCGVCASCHFIVHNACWHSLQTSLQIVPSSHTLVKSYTMMHARGTCLCLWLSLACRACDIKGMCVKLTAWKLCSCQWQPHQDEWPQRWSLPLVSHQMPNSASLHSHQQWVLPQKGTFLLFHSRCPAQRHCSSTAMAHEQSTQHARFHKYYATCDAL